MTIWSSVTPWSPAGPPSPSPQGVSSVPKLSVGVPPPLSPLPLGGVGLCLGGRFVAVGAAGGRGHDERREYGDETHPVPTHVCPPVDRPMGHPCPDLTNRHI